MRISIVVLSVLFSTFTLYPCTVFQVNQGEFSFGGANEDGPASEMMLHLNPPKDGEYGHINFIYKDGGGVQLGINDQGLFWDGLAAPEKDVEVDPEKETAAWNKLAVEVLKKCKTVDEAIDLYSTYDTTFNGVSAGYVIFGDRFGDAAVVEPDGTVVKKGDKDYFVASNFYLSDPEMAGSGGFDRYDKAETMLEQMDNLTPEYVRDVLRAIKQVITRFSAVYDLNNGIVYYYMERDYDNVAVIDVAKMVAEGEDLINAKDLDFRPHDEVFGKEEESEESERESSDRDSDEKDSIEGEFQDEATEEKRDTVENISDSDIEQTMEKGSSKSGCTIIEIY